MMKEEEEDGGDREVGDPIVIIGGGGGGATQPQAGGRLKSDRAAFCHSHTHTHFDKCIVVLIVNIQRRIMKRLYYTVVQLNIGCVK